MTRFEFKLKVKFIDEETGDEIYHKVLIDNSNGNEIGFDDMVGLLNNLHQENNILNKNEDDLKECTIENIKLKEENKQLKQEIKQYWKCRDKWKQEAKELKKENRELRHELDSLTGCYCADNKEFKHYWRIGYDD